MKKLMFIAYFIVTSTGFSAEKHVTITPEGFQLKNESGCVFDIPDKSSEEIYNSVLDYVARNYGRSDTVLRATTENSYVRFRFLSQSMAPFKRAGINLPIGGFNELEIDIKDEKMRIRMLDPELYINAEYTSPPYRLFVTGSLGTNSLFTKNNKPRKEMEKWQVKEHLEKFYSNLFLKIVDHVKKGSDDEW